MNKRLKLLLSVLAIAVIIAIVYFMAIKPDLSSTSSVTASSTIDSATTTMSGTKAKPVVRTATPTKPVATVAQPGTTSAPAPTVIWSLRDKSNPRDTSALYTAAVVSTETDEYDLGTLAGICKTIPDADLKGVGEISAIQCLNAGKGTEVGVFKQGNSYVVKSGSIVKGEAGQPDTRGTFTTLHTLK
jgi:hypothetical protein